MIDITSKVFWVYIRRKFIETYPEYEEVLREYQSGTPKQNEANSMLRMYIAGYKQRAIELGSYKKRIIDFVKTL